MADDDWNDDDFGTFESADASSADFSNVQVTGVTETPAWLLTPQKHKASASKNDAPVQPNETTPNIQDAQVCSKKNSEESNVDCETVAKQNEQKDFIPGGDWQAFPADHVKDSPQMNLNPVSSPIPEKNDSNIVVTGVESTISQKCVRETKDADVQVESLHDNQQILELQGKLDSALAMKVHTENSLEELRKELAKVVSESQEARKLLEERHENEQEELKMKHEKEIKTLQEESQKVMQMLTEKHVALSNQSAVELKSDHEKNLENVVEKCLDLLQSQSSILSEKLATESKSQSDVITNLIDTCQSELKDFVRTQCQSAESKCENIKGEMNEYFKCEIQKEIEMQREIDEECKKEAMEELSRSLKSQLEETMKIEREKSVDAVKCAVEEARNSVRKSMEREQEEIRSLRNQHVSALQMLLTSSQEHLRHLTDTFSPNNTK